MLVDGPKKAEVSVVVPAYKSKGTIVGCLEALVSQETDLPYEVIVVESSGDGAAGIIEERFPEVRLIRSEKRLLSGAARNRGAREASAGVLGFVDADCTVEDAWLAKMWRAHRERDCTAVGGAVLNGNPELSVSVSSYLTEFRDFYPVGRTRHVRYLPTCNITYKTAVFRKYGGFDPEEPLYVDLMFNTALSRAGEKLLFVPDIRATHLHRTSLREYLAHEFGRGRAAVVARRRGLIVGSSWVRNPALAFLAAPMLFLCKAAMFPCRFVRAYPWKVATLLRALPYFYLGLFAWHRGFLREVLSGREGARTGEEAARCANS